MDKRLEQMIALPPNAFVGERTKKVHQDSDEALFEVRLKVKLLIANVAMHIRDEWRTSLFRQLDEILDIEEWDSEDPYPKAESVRTFLRMIIFLRFKKCPGIGVSDGCIVAAWTKDRQRITIECHGNDRIQWVQSQYLEDDFLEIASGLTLVTRFPGAISTYLAEDDWLFDGKDQP